MTEVYHRSQRIDWATPQALFDKLNEEFKFTVDVAASAENAKCKKFFGVKLDGLKANWGGERVWCNPPYGRTLRQWVTKCSRGTSLAVALLPARTCTKWFHEIVMPTASEIRFIRGRVTFEGASHAAPFPSMLVIWRSGKCTSTPPRILTALQ